MNEAAETIITALIGAAPTLLYALRIKAKVEADKTQAVADATAALKAVAEQAQAMAQEALERARKADRNAMEAIAAEKKCAQSLKALSIEFNEFRGHVLGGST